MTKHKPHKIMSSLFKTHGSTARRRNAGAAKLVALGLTFVIVGGIFWLVYVQLTGLDGNHTVQSRHNKPTVPKKRTKPSIMPHSMSQNVVNAPLDAIDLSGEREPTEEELIQEAIERYLRMLRPSELHDDNIREYARLRQEFEDMLKQLPDSAIPAIKKLLENEPDFVNRRLLLYGLAGMGTEAAAEALRDFFLDHVADQSRQSELNHVIKALGLSDNVTSFNALMDFARNDANNFKLYRAHCVEAMGTQQLGYQALPLFQDYLVQDMNVSVRNKSAQAIKNVAKVDPEAARVALPTLMDKVRGGDATGLDPRTSRVVNDSKYVKQTSLGAIGQIGETSSIPFLKEIGTMDASFEVRLSAAAALSRMGGEEALTALDSVLIQQTADNQATLVSKLTQLKEPRLIPFFQDVAMSDLADPIRIHALNGLGGIGGADAEIALREILDGESNDAIRATITRKIELLAKKGGR